MTRTTADERQADVIVVGAGPAGAATAYQLAHAGVDVLLLEKAAFPRDKICGDGLTPRAVKQLIAMGFDLDAARLAEEQGPAHQGRRAHASSCRGPTWPTSRRSAWSGPAWTSTSCSPGTRRRPAPG